MKLTGALIALTTALIVSGCTASTKQAARSTDAPSLTSSAESIVLARLVVDMDGKEHAVTGRWDPREGYSVGLVHFDTGQFTLAGTALLYGQTRPQPGDHPFDSPNSYARENGWVKFVVQPGAYYLAIQPPWGFDPLNAEHLSVPNDFRFMVPTQSSVVYVGTFHVDCTSKMQEFGPGTFFQVIGNCSPDVTVSDDTNEAIIAGMGYIGQLGDVKTRLARPNGTYTADAALPLEKVAIRTTATTDLVPPEWRQFGESAPLAVYERNRALGKEISAGYAGLTSLSYNIGRSSFDIGRSSGSLAGLSGAVVPAANLALVIVILAAAGVSEVVADNEAEAAEHEWRPCVEDLEHQLRQFDLAAEFSRELRERLPTTAVAADDTLTPDLAPATTGPGASIQADIHRVQLRKCLDAGSYCMEIGVRMRAFAGTRHFPVFDKSYLYSNPIVVPDGGYARHPWSWFGSVHKPWEALVEAQTSTCRDISAYCGDDGRALLAAELKRGLDAIAGEFVRDLSNAEQQRAENERKEAARLAAENALEERGKSSTSQTALLARPLESSAKIDRNELVGNPKIKQIIKHYFNKSGIRKKTRGEYGFNIRWALIEMTDIHRMSIVTVSGNVATVEIDYGSNGHGVARNGHGVATIEKIGSSFRVIMFETGGKTYGPLAN